MTDTPLTPAQIAQAQKNSAHESYPHRDLVAVDQMANVLAGGLPDETISSRVRRVSDAHPGWSWNPGVWVAKALNAGLNLIQTNHGEKAQVGDIQRAQNVEKTDSGALAKGQ